MKQSSKPLVLGRMGSKLITRTRSIKNLKKKITKARKITKKSQNENTKKITRECQKSKKIIKWEKFQKQELKVHYLTKNIYNQ